MKILITGGAGLIGSHCAEFYAKKGWDVVVLDNLMRSKLFGYDKESVEYNWNYLGNFKNIKRVKGDVRNKEVVLKAIGEGVDVCIHAAGQPGVAYSIRNPEDDFSINAFGTFNVLECLRQISPQVIFIYCSTNKVYGENVDKIPIQEQEKRYNFKDIKGISEVLPIDHTGHTPYGVSKYIGDIYTQEYARIYGMKTGVFRMSCIYGERQFGFEDQGWVAWFIIAAYTGKKITIYGNGKQVRDVLYVGDLISAYDRFINSDLKAGVWNTGGGCENTTSLLEFLEVLERKLGKKIEVSFAGWRPFDQKVYVSDLTEIKKALRWRPEVNFEQGIEKILTWIKENRGYFE